MFCLSILSEIHVRQVLVQHIV